MIADVKRSSSKPASSTPKRNASPPTPRYPNGRPRRIGGRGIKGGSANKPEGRKESRETSPGAGADAGAGAGAGAGTSVSRGRTRTRTRGPQRNSLAKSASREIIRSFYSTVGRDVWVSALESLPLGSPGGKLLALMHDAAFDSCSIEKLCSEAGLDIPGLVRLFTDYKVGEAIVEAASKSRDVVMGLAIDASPSERVCRTCVGFLHVKIAHPLTGEPVEIDCFDCDGTGRTRTPGDPRKLETFLKVMHAADEDRGPLVQVNTQFNFGAQHSMGVARGQELLALGRKSRENVPTSAPPPPSSVTIDVESSVGASKS